MGVFNSALLAILLTLIAGTTCNQPFTAEMIARGVISVSNQVFGSSLYEAIRNVEGNLALSPFSAQAVVSMALFGANGTTAGQLESALGLVPESHNFLSLGFKEILTDLKSTNTVTLEMANKLYLQKNFQVKDTFQLAMRESFLSEVEQVDFANELQKSRNSINQCVQEKTHGKITDLISEDTLSEASLLVAVNALYFKGGWAKPFDEQKTTTKPFHVTASTTVNVPMMEQTAHFLYTENVELGFKVLGMRYRGANDDPTGEDQTMSMLILLPNEIDGLSKVEAFVTAGNLTQIMTNLNSRTVTVSLPRFKIESCLNLVSALNKLGVTDLFSDGADLSKITNGSIYVSKILQKTLIEVTEKGTEAAAVTFIEDAVKMADVTIPTFNADHPFMFVVMDHINFVNLFIGRVVQPN